MKRYTSLLFLLLFPFILSAQKTERVCGEYTYHAPSDKSLEEAKRIALERAKIQALANEFGTIVTQNNSTLMRNENGKTDSHFFSLSDSEVKGEWLEDTGEPQYKISYEQEMLVVQCSVCGKARALSNSAVDFTAQVLRNGTEEKFAGSEFRGGDDMFLLFQSPVSGYVAVYLVDQTPTAYCLLPYQRDSDGEQPVKHGEKYIFFSPKLAKEASSLVDEYTLTCGGTMEHNQIYIIFSPNPFVKALDMQNNELLPRELSYEEFSKWLGKCRKRDTKMGVKRIDISIQP